MAKWKNNEVANISYSKNNSLILVASIFPVVLIMFGLYIHASKAEADTSEANAVNLPAGLLYRLYGNTPVDEFGHSVAVLGDINKDGFNEILIGAPNDDVGFNNAGAARVYSGRDQQVLQMLSGDAADWFHGSGVGNAGDIDRDGVDDVMVGMKASGKTGLGLGGGARVFSGRSGKVLYFFAGDILDDKFGQTVSGVGDVNADGWNDMAVGAPGTYKNNTPGYVYVYSGKDGNLLYKLQGRSSKKGDRFGFHVNRAGDVNGDGYADVLVGSIGDDDNGWHSGAAYVFSGKDGKIIYRFIGDKSPDELGHSVSAVDDLDGDSLPDILAGAFNVKAISYARVYGSRDGKVIYEVRGDEVNDGFGHSIAGVGDVNNDGVKDFLAGAPDASLVAPVPWYKRWFVDKKTPGYARVYSGADGSVIATYFGEANKHIGYVVSGAGDINNDGFADMLIGSTVFDDVGEVWIVSACAVLNNEKNISSYSLLRWQAPNNNLTKGNLKISGLPENTTGWVHGCDISAKKQCNKKQAIFSLPFTVQDSSTSVLIPFTPRMPELSGKRVGLSVEAVGKIQTTGMEAILCR